MPLQPLHTRSLATRREYRRERLSLAGAEATTVHVAEFDLASTTPRVVAIPGTLTLAGWCGASGVADAVVGGFFTRPETVPLGELWIDGRRRGSVPFDPPWAELRSCVAIDAGRLRIAPRPALAAAPRGDLLQAGPLLVAGGEVQVAAGHDPEGFSAGQRQFDSDITLGRYPRAALGLAGGRLIAAVCEGRAANEAGLTLVELAEAMVALGAETALNLDGGGSASLVFDGRLVNRPREEHGIELARGRPIATAIAFDPA